VGAATGAATEAGATADFFAGAMFVL
jgi:hypothetical protein